MKEKSLIDSELGDYASGASNGVLFSISGSSNVYSTSNVKNAVEGYMFSKNMEDDLESDQNNYKIRLITLNELQQNLGLSKTKSSARYGYYYDFDRDNTPEWVYSWPDSTLYSYWTMSPYSGNSRSVWYVQSSGILRYSTDSNNYAREVRPVINLKKSAI